MAGASTKPTFYLTQLGAIEHERAIQAFCPSAPEEADTTDMRLGSLLLSARFLWNKRTHIDHAAEQLAAVLTGLMETSELGTPCDNFQLLGPEKMYLSKYVAARRKDVPVMPLVAFALASETITDEALIDGRLRTLVAFAAAQATAADPYIISV